jgi:HAD superfamily hydrolase (TIGR01484 family)
MSEGGGAAMQPLAALSRAVRSRIHSLLTDIDDTLSTHGRITAAAYAGMERLRTSGRRLIPITGRPAGWCDHIARMWPVDGVVGENGAFYMVYDATAKKLRTRFAASDAQREENRRRITDIAARIVRAVPGCAVASDQRYRETDLAIDCCEDVAALPPESVEHIVALMRDEGMTAKVSSIHVNGWFGTYDKLAMTRTLFAEVFGIDLDAQREGLAFVGDSPNDAPMFGFFPHSIGVANVRQFIDRIVTPPRFVTQHEAGAGFIEVVDALLAAQVERS